MKFGFIAKHQIHWQMVGARRSVSAGRLLCADMAAVGAAEAMKSWAHVCSLPSQTNPRGARRVWHYAGGRDGVDCIE